MKLSGIVFITVGCLLMLSFFFRVTPITNWYIKHVPLLRKNFPQGRLLFIIIGCLCIVVGAIIILYDINIKLPWYE